MIVLQCENDRWYCMNTSRVAQVISQLFVVENAWYQPFDDSDFFQYLKDGLYIYPQIPQRGWDKDFPLSKCIEGNVKFVGTTISTKPPKWYRDLLSSYDVKFK